MSELKPIDDSLTGNEKEDEYETPPVLYENICKTYGIYPQLDAAANKENTKCPLFLTDSLAEEWGQGQLGSHLDIWINPPHSKTKEFVLRADQQWKKYNINIIMLIPANSICARYFDHILPNPNVKYYRVGGRITFYRNGKPSKFPSRNGYFVVIWNKI